MLSVGIIGFGRIGKEHAAWINASSNARAIAAFDPTPARRQIATDLGLKTFDSLDALLSDPTIDAVLVSTPTAMHFADAARAIAAGKHVMVEKPIGLDAAEGQKLHEQATAAGRVLSVFHCRRWDNDFLTVKQAVDSGVFGKLINVESRLGQWSSCVGPAAREYRPNWRNEKSFGGGGLYDWGSHFVDQLHLLLAPAKPVRVFAQMTANVWSQDCDDFARLLIDFDNGCSTLCEINTVTTRPLPRWHIDGTLGSGESPFSLAFDTHEWAKLTFTSSDGTTQQIPEAAKGLNESQIWDRFARACRGDGAPAVDVPSVLLTMRLLDAARQSAAEGHAVQI